ncbi:MAG: zinc ABC transporter substrate-binding protein [Cyanobacterium sp. T60_A2020_053]|nr:zinc ABC transporter substrate-binding protein [Cyanobacterium sp. T60_A2020_053]
MKNWQKTLIKISALTLLLSGCGSVNNQSSDKPQVVSTTTIIGDLTAQIAGDEINHSSILKAGEDPHIYEPVPQDNIILEEADLIIYNGYNLEPNLIKQIYATVKVAETLAVGEVVKPLDFEYEGQKAPDPHVWGDVSNVKIMAEAIRDELIELYPVGEETFRNNTSSLLTELSNLDEWIKTEIGQIPPDDRKLVTTHDAFQYYANAYGLEIPGTLIGISTEEQPSALTLRNLVETIKATNIKAIFAETTINPALITTVAREAGVKLANRELYADSVGAEGSDADTYIKMMKTNTTTIVEALK